MTSTTPQQPDGAIATSPLHLQLQQRRPYGAAQRPSILRQQKQEQQSHVGSAPPYTTTKRASPPSRTIGAASFFFATSPSRALGFVLSLYVLWITTFGTQSTSATINKPTTSTFRSDGNNDNSLHQNFFTISTTAARTTSTTVSNNEEQQSQQQAVEAEADAFGLTADRMDWSRRQTLLEGGAFVHIGKTGGSTLSVLLRNGCHSWLTHPCRTIAAPESWASRLISSYYHVADFGLLPESHHDFYVVTVRDPYDRTLSALSYLHYRNMDARQEANLLPRKFRMEYQRACLQCFPTLDVFVQHLVPTGPTDQGPHKDFSYPYHQSQIVTFPCRDLVRAIFAGLVRPFSHLFFNYQRLKRLMLTTKQPPESTNNSSKEAESAARVLVVTRLEFLERDWTTVNQYIATHFGNQTTDTSAANSLSSAGPNTKTDTSLSLDHHLRQTSHLALPVSRNLTHPQDLCRAMQPEYNAYFWFLSQAKNLQTTDVAQSLVLARQRCPQIAIDFGRFRKQMST